MDLLGSAFKKIIGRLKPKEQPAPEERIYIGSFGKHPAWDDHIEDIGLQTDLLINLKRFLYIQGIGGNIDAGNWARLSEENQLVNYGHSFCWTVEQFFIVGRMFQSQDGKGRDNYPMTVCVQCFGLPLEWALKNVLPALESLEQNCMRLSACDDVTKLIFSEQERIRISAKEYIAENPEKPSGLHHDALSYLAEVFKNKNDFQGLLRIMYHIEREIKHLDLGDSAGKKNKDLSLASRSISIRVPLYHSPVSDMIVAWISFIFTKLGKQNPLFMASPDSGSWLDIFAGEPGISQIFALRASLKTVPLTSSVPYNMEDDFIERAKRLVMDTKRPNSHHISIETDRE